MDKVVHFEIPAKNVPRAQKFYTKVFGWKANPIPEMKYTIFQTGPVDKKKMAATPGFINGGMTKANAMMKGPVITISVASIEKSLKAINSMGGKTLKGKMPIGEMGYIAYFKDSEGNVTGLFQMKKK